jgi:hypothetical protein
VTRLHLPTLPIYKEETQLSDMMACDESLLLALPLELRNAVYDCASERPAGPYLILKEYFEKIDQSIPRLPAHVSTAATEAADPDNDDNHESEGEDSGEVVEVQDAAGDENGQEETMIDADSPVTTAQQQVPTEQQAEETQSGPGADQAVMQAENDGQDEVTEGEGANLGDAASEDVGMQDNVVEDENDEDESEDDDLPAENENDDEEEEEEEEDQDGVDDDEEDDEDDAEDAATASQPARTPCSYGRNTKYRHVLPILQLSHCPPPKELLQLCKQIHVEAVQQHRDKCVLTINVNKGFQHMSFFTETMNTLTHAPHSPLEHIRKLRLVIVWDSEWLREKTTPPDREIEEPWFFNFYFSERMQVILDVISACPELQKVFIEYHDSEDTADSRTTMADKLRDLRSALDQKFYTNADDFPAPVVVEHQENFSAPGTAHARNSVLALHRAEFDRILLSGLNMH